MTVHSQHRQVLTYLLLQKTILFLTFYEYLNRLIQNSKPHAVIQAGTRTYTYDANGNMTQRPDQTITYDYENRPISINRTTFIYDYSGRRVKKNNTIYIGKLYECTSGTCTKYIFEGSSRIASKTAAATYYYHTDHLGSSSIITDSAGNKVEEIYYYPFGGTRLNQGSVNVKHKYTGQEEDSETGLYFYNARYYDPQLARFISADSIVQEPDDPQSFNRYSYTRNNPLIYTDPTGNFFDTYNNYGGWGGGCYWCSYDPWYGSSRSQQEAYWDRVASNTSSSSSSSSSSTSTSSSSSTSTPTPTPAPTPASSTQIYSFNYSSNYSPAVNLPRTSEYFGEGSAGNWMSIQRQYVNNTPNINFDLLKRYYLDIGHPIMEIVHNYVIARKINDLKGAILFGMETINSKLSLAVNFMPDSRNIARLKLILSSASVATSFYGKSAYFVAVSSYSLGEAINDYPIKSKNGKVQKFKDWLSDEIWDLSEEIKAWHRVYGEE